MCLQNGVRGLMLDTYDFNNDVWLCHSFGGTCYNITAFVRLCDQLNILLSCVLKSKYICVVILILTCFFFRSATSHQCLKRNPDIPWCKPIRSNHDFPGRLHRCRFLAESIQSFWPYEVLVPSGQNAKEWWQLAFAQGHDQPEPTPASFHIKEIEGSKRGDRIRVELCGRKPM